MEKKEPTVVYLKRGDVQFQRGDPWRRVVGQAGRGMDIRGRMS